MRRVALGLVFFVVLAGALVISRRGSGVSATNARPWPMESAVARAAWRFLIPADIRRASNPVSASDTVLADARTHWADHCALCHANDGSGDTPVGRRVYPPPPDLRTAEAQRLSDGELFYAIEQGIPWTAMPGWANGTPEGERESWTLVAFIRHLPKITPQELTDMEALNPRPPRNAAREREIDDFLSGPAGTSR